MYGQFVATFYGRKEQRFWVECALKNMENNYQLQKNFYNLPKSVTWMPLIVLNELHGSTSDKKYCYETVDSLIHEYIGNPEYRQFMLDRYEIQKDKILVYFSSFNNKREFFNELADIFNVRITLKNVKSI